MKLDLGSNQLFRLIRGEKMLETLIFNPGAAKLARADGTGIFARAPGPSVCAY